MIVKVFQTNKNGKIEFTRPELEKLLNEVYGDGYKAGEAHMRENYWTWSPSLVSTQTLPITYRNTVDCTTNAIDNLQADKVSVSLNDNEGVCNCAKSAISSKDYPESATKVAMADCAHSTIDPLEGTITADNCVANTSVNNSTTRSVLFTPTQVVNIKGTSLADAVDAILNSAFRMEDVKPAPKKPNDVYDKLAKELTNL